LNTVIPPIRCNAAWCPGYATVLGPWWGLDASAILQQRFELLPLLRA
jgi:hypothetical protein